jgi:predicted RNA-binding Zn ribbon-like protein
VEFTFGSGSVALDLAGTVRHRRGAVLDLLGTPDDLARWVADSGLVDRPVPADAAGLADAVRLREAVYRLAYAASEGAEYRAADLRVLNEFAAHPPVGTRLAADGTVRRVGDLPAVLAEVGRAAVELLGGPLARTIRECAAPDCTQLHVDGSRRGSRRWCDMRTCGNRAKAAGFRARHATP